MASAPEIHVAPASLDPDTTMAEAPAQNENNAVLPGDLQQHIPEPDAATGAHAAGTFRPRPEVLLRLHSETSGLLMMCTPEEARKGACIPACGMPESMC